jgi:hypothetical protein
MAVRYRLDAWLLTTTLVACRGDDDVGAVEVGGTLGDSDSSSSSTDTDTSTDTAETDDTTTGNEECTTAADCPPEGTCEDAPTCDAGFCNYAPLPVGTSCDDDDACTANLCDGAGACLSSAKVCNEPPDFDVAAACSGGQTTFMAPGACGGSCVPATGECEYPLVELACPPASAELAQQHPYQVVLREFLASLDQADFEVALAPLTYDPADLQSDDDRYRTAILLANNGYYAPNNDGLRVPASVFTLAAIEQPGAVLMSAGRNNYIEPTATLWWQQWDLPGNPYQGQKALRMRAFVSAAVDLIMRDADTEGGGVEYAIAMPLTWFGSILLGLEDGDVDECTKLAFEQGARRLIGKLEGLHNSNGNNDMAQGAHAGLYMVAQASGDAELMARAIAESQQIFTDYYHPAGYMDHGGGYDASYEGISLFFLVWAGLESGWPHVIDVIRSFETLKAHLSLPEPDGRYTGPSHFSPATSAPSVFDQWGYYHRDLGSAMLVPEAHYHVFSVEEPPLGVPDAAELDARIQNGIAGINTTLIPSNELPLPWSANAWTEFNLGGARYQAGFYEQMQMLAAEQGETMLPPFARADSFARDFDDEFLIAKYDDLGVVLHAGPLNASWAGPPGTPTGFSGGAISAFWTADAGAALLGVAYGSQNTQPGPDSWAEWRSWPTHAVSGLAADNKPFSSARILEPVASAAVRADSATMSVSGTISSADGGHSAPNDALLGDVAYAREFEVDASGLVVTTTLDYGGPTQVSELYETIPVFLGQGGQDAAVSIELVDSMGSTVPASTDPVADVVEIRILRFDGLVVITLEEPRPVKLAPNTWSTTYQWTASARAVLIDLLDGGGTQTLPSLSFSYSIAPG